MLRTVTQYISEKKKKDPLKSSANFLPMSQCSVTANKWSHMHFISIVSFSKGNNQNNGYSMGQGRTKVFLSPFQSNLLSYMTLICLA